MKNKKTFQLFVDNKWLFDKLPDDKAWQLIKHIFAYVNDEHPKTDDLVINVAFEPIKLQLKRDLEKRKETCEKNSKNWKLWWRPIKNYKPEQKPTGYSKKPSKARKADTDTDTDTDTEKEINKEKNLTYLQELEELIKKWNWINQLGVAKKPLPKVRKIETVIGIWKKVRKTYTVKEIKEWLNNYCEYVDRLPVDNKWFYTHRFSLYEFLKQKNWLDKYFNQ